MVPSRIESPHPRARHIRFRTTDPRLVAFATDLDRTLLRPGGRPTRIARTAVRTAREMGLRTLLVSGRRYSELVPLARALGGFDGIVAENGAVVEAPWSTPPTVVGRRTAAMLRRRLEGIPELHCEFGQVVVSVPREERPRLLDAVGRLPVHIVGNVDRVMVLPRGVSKRSGTQRALRQLGLAGRAYAAIGDAENDLDLLRGARLTGAVANAEPEVRRAVDYVSRGRFETGVLEFVNGPLSDLIGAAVTGSGLRPDRRAPARAPRRRAC